MSPASRRARSLATVAILLGVFGLAGCSRTVKGTAFAPSLDLAHKLQHSMDAVTSAHVELRVDAGGLLVVASGDEKLDHAAATAFALTEHIAGLGEIKVIEVSGNLYVHLPVNVNPTNKPWVLIRPDTTDPNLVPLAQALQQVQDSASLRQYALLARTASEFRDVGPSEVNGVATELYSFSVLVGRLPQSMPGASVLRASGVRALPIQLWVDDQNRVRRISESISIAGHSTSSRLDLTKFDAPVVISAPPADQVATR